MAFYKDPHCLEKSTLADFDKILQPGEKAPFAGIYRCESCKREIVSPKGASLPLVDHHTHKSGGGPVLWRLIVAHA